MNDYKTHETRKGTLCTDLFDVIHHDNYERMENGRIYRLCAFGTYEHPRFEWVRESNVRPVLRSRVDD